MRLLIALLFSFDLSAQTLLYDVFLFGDKIGSTTIQRLDEGNGRVRYRVRSNSNARVLFITRTNQMEQDVLYENGQLTSSYCRNLVDEVENVVTVTWQSAKYIVRKGMDLLTVDEPVKLSSASMYFNEPVNASRIFSERIGRFVPVQQLGKNKYELQLPDGVTNVIQYKDGIPVEIEMKKTLGSAVMKLVGVK